MLLSLVLACTVLASANPISYGKGVTLSDSPIPLADAVKNMKAYDGKEIVVKAEVEKVCQKEGCWIVLKDNETTVHVQFFKHSFVVPKDTGKYQAVVQGKLSEKEISAAAARHYAKDAKASAEEIAKIQSPKKVPWFVSTGLTLTKN